MLQRRDLPELLIAFPQQRFVGIIQPITFTMHHGMKGLGIELGVVHGDVCFDGSRHLHTNEAAVTRKVGQQVLVIARGNERGIAADFLYTGAVRFTQAGRRLLQQMLQECLLIDADLVELIQIYQEESSQISFGIALAAEIQAVGVAETEFGRQQDTAEGGLAISLRANQYRCRGITVLLVASQPMRHHTQEPAIAEVTPMGMTALHPVGQFTDAVTPIPFVKFKKIFLHGIVQGHGFGMQEAVNIPVPCLDTLLQCADGHTVPCTLVQASETEPDTVPLAVFHIVGHLVVADFIPAFQKFFQTQGRILLACHGRMFPESLHRPIDIVESGTEARLIFEGIKMSQGAAHGLLFRNARLVAFRSKRRQQREKVISPLPFTQRIKSPSQGRLEHHRQCMIGVVVPLHAGKRILFRQLPFTKGSAVRQAGRLCHAKGRSLGVVIRMLVQRHAETLPQRRFL